MKRSTRSLMTLVLILAIALFSYLNQEKPADNVNEVSVTTAETTADSAEEVTTQSISKLDEQSAYYETTDVALYIHTYGKLPKNYLTKNEAMDLGWDSEKGNLWLVTDKMVIGGDKFGNREGLLPNKKGRTWYECDVDYNGGYRDAKRIVFSNDGLIYYSDDHYASFEKLYE